MDSSNADALGFSSHQLLLAPRIQRELGERTGPRTTCRGAVALPGYVSDRGSTRRVLAYEPGFKPLDKDVTLAGYGRLATDHSLFPSRMTTIFVVSRCECAVLLNRTTGKM